MFRIYLTLLSAIAIIAASGQSAKLTGRVIGTELSVDYNTFQQSTTANTKEMAMDGDFNTCFASFDRSFTWVGLELDQPYVITSVGYAARNDGLGPGRMQLGVFQGANQPDFSDALPLYLIPEPGVIGQMTYADVNCSRGFKYVRYVGPHDARCNVAEIEFYGYPGTGDDSSLYQPTNLPLVVVNTPGMEWFHENDKSYAMEGSTVYVIADGTIDTGASAQIRGRGNASWDNFPKKPFRIKFDKKQRVLGSPAKAKKWTMIANYGDKTLMRNMLAFEISRRMGMDFTPVCHPVDLIFNGEYQGCYQLCDQIEVADHRVEITEMSAEDTEGEALTGGYLIEIDAYAYKEPADEQFTSTGGHSIPVTIKSPDPGVSLQYYYIRNYFSKLERAVFAYNYGDPDKGYRQLLDEDSFLRHFLVGELSGNTDTYWSVYMTLERGDSRFRTGPCWDFDLAFENDTRTYPINNKNDFICLANGSFANGMKDFVRRIVKTSAGSKDRLSWIWSDARVNRRLNPEEFDQLISQYAELLQQSQALNFKRWPIMDQRVHQNPKVWGSYEAEVENVRNYLSRRFDKLDQIIGRVPVEGIADIGTDTGDFVVEDSRLVISGEAPYAVATPQGMVVASGRGAASLTLPAGLYILRLGSRTLKLAL